MSSVSPTCNSSTGDDVVDGVVLGAKSRSVGRMSQCGGGTIDYRGLSIGSDCSPTNRSGSLLLALELDPSTRRDLIALNVSAGPTTLANRGKDSWQGKVRSLIPFNGNGSR